MEIMNEKDRKKLILETRKFGGISLRHQTLRVHKNGAKFPISKVYTDDEVLDPNISYTLILLPEPKIASETKVSLSLFKRKKGPVIFYSFPEKSLNFLEEESVANSMTQSYNEKFFIHQSSLVSSLNYYFEIHSDWARGNKEMLLVSVILDQMINQANEEMIYSLCEQLESQFNSNKDIFKALYLDEMERFKDEDQVNIKRNYEGLIIFLKDFYNTIITNL